MKWSAVLALVAVPALADAPPRPTIAYSADVVVVSKGETMRSHVVSDGIHRSSKAADGKSGSFVDTEKKLQWMYSPALGCMQMPLRPEGLSSSSREEVLGRETVDGHPSEKVRVTMTVTTSGKTTSSSVVEWRAADLQNLVIRRRSDAGDYEQHLENIVMGKPDAKALAFPSPPCKYDEYSDTTRYAPESPGGFRTISFSDASCKQLVPLPLTMSIPSQYAIRSGGTRGCLWGTSADLDRVLAGHDQLDFESIEHGVFWCRVSGSTGYDPRTGFISSDGPQATWTNAMKSAGARNVQVESRAIGDIPSARVTATFNGQRAYMLYLAVPGTDSPAILINYHPAGKGSAADDSEWQRFLGSIQRTSSK